MGKLRWGVLGCASIAVNKVIPGINRSKSGSVWGIASRDAAKAVKAAEELNIPRTYGSYEQLLEDPDIDAVYVPLPNHLHREWTIRAAMAGKHVLCEKPMALTEQEANEMAEACRVAGVVLMEAFMYRFHPQWALTKAIVDAGDIGKIRSIHGSFTLNNAADLGNIRYKPNMGGGAIYDLGCYPVSAARLLLEQEPETATVTALFSPEHGNVDMMATGLVGFPGGEALTFNCGLWSGYRDHVEIIGSDGLIVLPAAFLPSLDKQAEVIVVNGEGERLELVDPINSYAEQADQFAAAIAAPENPRYSASDGVMNMRAIEACLQSAESKTTAIIEPIGRQ